MEIEERQPKIISTESPSVEPKVKKHSKSQKLKARAQGIALDSFVLSDLKNAERVRLFQEIFKEDFKERSNEGRPLTAGQAIHAEKLAKEIVSREKKRVCVITVKDKMRKKAVEPIGFVTFNIRMAAGMNSSETVFEGHRIFLKEDYRGLELSPRILLRALGRAHQLSSTLRYASLRDPFQFLTPKIVESMRRRGWVSAVEKRMHRNDLFVELNPFVLEEEARVIRAFDRFKASSLLRKPIERARLAIERKRYRKNMKEREKREMQLKRFTPRH